MRNGFFVGIPLTLLQIGVHRHTGGLIDPYLVANNFLLANAVYDADRIEGDIFAKKRIPTRISALGSSAFFATDSSTAILIPLLWFLHFGYTRVKPWIAPIKPFLVAGFWVLAVYWVPIARSAAGGVGETLFLPSSLFLLMVASSHAVDIVDIDEDRENGVSTPACLMHKEEARHYAIACAITATWFYSLTVDPLPLVDVFTISIVTGISYNLMMYALAASLFTTIIYLDRHWIQLLNEALCSTEAFHKTALQGITYIVDHADELPPQVQSQVIDGALHCMIWGDNIGSALLRIYDDIITQHFLLR